MSLLAQIGATDWARGFRPRSCAGASCGRWLTERQLRVRPVGVTLSDVWYCSYRCVIQSVETAMRKLVAPVHRGGHTGSRRSLGLSLLQRNLLSEDQYKTAIAAQRDTKREMGDALISLGFLGEEVIAEARAALWSCPVMSWEPRLSNNRVHLPGLLTQHYGMMPVHLQPSMNRLFLGFRHDVEYVPLFAVEQIMGCKVQPCILPFSNYVALTEAQRNEPRYEERVFGETSTIGDMTRLLCETGREVNAVTIALARCGHYIWGRLDGGSRTIDTLFGVA